MEALLAKAEEIGLDLLSITDHDTHITYSRAQSVSKGKPRLIPGMELSATYHSGRVKEEVHILGYDMTFDDYFQRDMERLYKSKQERIKRIIEKLKGFGFEIPYDLVKEIAGEGPATIPHYLKALHRLGRILSITDAVQFAKDYFFSEKVYVFHEESVAEMIELIHRGGGMAVLAHPYMIKNQEIIDEIAAHGLDGIEVYYSEWEDEKREHYLDLAEKYSLLTSAGSDYHGLYKPGYELGRIPIPEGHRPTILEVLA